MSPSFHEASSLRTVQWDRAVAMRKARRARVLQFADNFNFI
jgi:hypothetical protein